MNEFERQLQDCLEALTEGRWDLDECLRRCPEHADELRAQFLTMNTLVDAFAAEADPQWAQDARRRFLIATGQSIAEATDVEPSPSFFSAARVRFLLAAQRLRQEGAAKSGPRRLPLFGSPIRAVGALAASVVLFFGFSTYTIATASAALPGDWQYPVKLQTERVRLALAFSDSAERDVKLDIAEERIHEIEQLASKGKIIGPGELDRLVDHTEPLVEEAADQKLSAEDAARLQDVASRSVKVLDSEETQVASDAQDQLEEAKSVSATGVSVTSVLVSGPDGGRQPIVITPQVPVQVPTRTPVPPTEEPTESAESPTSEPPADATEEPAPDTPPAGGEQPSDSVVVSDAPIIDLGTIQLYQLTAGQLKILSPGTENGWYMDNLPSAGVPNLLTIRAQDQQAFVVLSTVTGDMYWYVSPNRDNRFDEVQMHITRNGQTFIADPAVLRLMYGSASEIPILIMQSIELLPVPSLEDEPTPTSTAAPEAP